MSHELEKSFVPTAFREFYAEVIRLRAGVLKNPWGIAEAGSTPERDAQLRQGAAQRLSDLLLRKLEELGLEAGRREGEYGAGWFREAQDVMATLADEVFLHLEWQGRSAWAANLLETRLRGTHVGGERFFDRLDALLRDPDPLKRPLAAVYLLALSLGFQGRWRGVPGGAERLEEYRTKTFAFVYPGHLSVAAGQRRLFPEAYEHTLEKGEPLRLPHTRRWLAAAAAVLLFFLVASHRVWMQDTRQVRAQVESVRAQEDSLTRVADRLGGRR
jgi:type VI secretion system protein ImpK